MMYTVNLFRKLFATALLPLLMSGIAAAQQPEREPNNDTDHATPIYGSLPMLISGEFDFDGGSGLGDPSDYWTAAIARGGYLRVTLIRPYSTGGVVIQFQGNAGTTPSVQLGEGPYPDSAEIYVYGYGNYPGYLYVAQDNWPPGGPMRYALRIETDLDHGPDAAGRLAGAGSIQTGPILPASYFQTSQGMTVKSLITRRPTTGSIPLQRAA